MITTVNSRVTEELIIRRAQGNAYAWGREDASHVPTVKSHLFGDAYVAAWGAFAVGHVAYMPSVQSAYSAWQRSNGRTVYGNLVTSDASNWVTDWAL